MKNMIKRIIVGVAIGTILFIIKGGNVFAASSSQAINNNQFITSASAKFDVCQEDGDELICINGFNKSFSVFTNTFTTLYSNSNKIIGLRELSLEIDFPNGYQPTIYKYANFSDLSFIFTRETGDNNYGYLPKSTLAANRFPIYIQITTTDNTVCEPSVFGSALGLNTNVQNQSYFEVPSNCQDKQLAKFVITYTPGVNYVGNKSAVLSTNPSDISSMSVNDYISLYRNNTYLLVWNKKNITVPDNQSQYLSIRFNSSTYPSSNTRVQNTYTLEEQQVQQNLEELKKQIYLASLGGTDLGPDRPSSNNYSELSDGLTDFSDTIGDSLSGYDFEGFLNALVLKPIQELESIPNTPEQTFNVVSCSSAPNRIYFNWSMALNQDLHKWSMEWPCMTNVYENMPWLTTNYVYSLVSVWHLVVYGFLYYYLCLTYLNLIKYTITRSKSEIEVIEL